MGGEVGFYEIGSGTNTREGGEVEAKGLDEESWVGGVEGGVDVREVVRGTGCEEEVGWRVSC